MTFAAIETRLNAVAIARLANCTATLDGGEAFGGIFKEQYLDPLGMSGSQPALECDSADVSTAAHGSAVVVTYKAVETSYTVAAIQPDGTGISRLLLQEV
jgi:hypothetical protein